MKPFAYQDESGKYSIDVGVWVGGGWKTRYIRLAHGFDTRSEASAEILHWRLSADGWVRNA